MSSDIVKEAVFDGRIIQSRPKYAVEKGALSVTNAPFSAISATASQHTYNIYVPSENVFVDRAIEWSSTCFLSLTATPANTTPGQVVATLGRDIALCAFPLNSLCATLTTTINDTTSVINSADVQREVLRLADYKQNRLRRTCPTMLDKYARYADAVGTNNNPNGGFDTQNTVDTTPNGAWGDIYFTDQNGTVLSASQTPAYTYNGYAVNTDAFSRPIVTASNGANSSYPLFVKWRSTEKLILSPFVFADTREMDTGLFGINNIQLIMNLRAPTRALRNPGVVNGSGCVISNVAFASTPFADSFVNTQFLTPSLEVALPPKSVVPYMEFPRYITQNQNSQVNNGQTVQLTSQTITLPQIPDLLLIYVKPTQAGGQIDPTLPQYADTYLPPVSGLTLTGGSQGNSKPLSIQFDNFSGLLSSHTAEQLYDMSVRNGLEMDWEQWSGKTRTSANNGSLVGTTGGFLVLKPGRDITLQSGQAPSLVGNFTLQFNLSVYNPLPCPVIPQMFVVTVNSGFFESIRGSSRIIKGVLSEQDIISAPLAPVATHSDLMRLTGGKGLLGSLGNILSRAKDVYHATKPAVSAMKGMLPAGMRGVAEAVGYGSGGASGGGSGGRKGKKSIEDRLC